jgi:phosphomannomutase
MFTVWKTFDKEAIFIKHIFRQYDIRGLVGKELSYELMQDIARAFAVMAVQEGYTSILVGRDNRISSPSLRDAVVAINSTWPIFTSLLLLLTILQYINAKY